MRRSKVLKLSLAILALALAFTVVALLGFGDYLRLLRPKVLKQLNPDVVRLLNELPEVDHQNEVIVGRLFAHGGLATAQLSEDGVYRSTIEVEEGEYLWKPAIIVMEKSGVLELEFFNPDKFSHHAALLPSNGNRVIVKLPPLERAKARIELDGPGLYWFGCPVANHAGRGMLGLVLVGGGVPDEAKLDRPEQSRQQSNPGKQTK